MKMLSIRKIYERSVKMVYNLHAKQAEIKVI